MSEPFTGGCTCGNVRYTCTAENPAVYACHCTACQRRTGSAFGVSLRVPTESLKIETGNLKQVGRAAESGNTIVHNFCADCGNAIFGQGPNPALRILYGGTLDDPRRIAIQANIWTRSAVPWVHIDPDLPSFPQHPPMPGQSQAADK